MDMKAEINASLRRSSSSRVAVALCLTAVLAVATAWSGCAHADVLVLESSTTAIQAGSVLPTAATFDVPQGGRLVVMLPNGRTEVVDGPRKGSVKDLSSETPADKSLWDAVGKMISGQAGSDRNVGATRSAIARPVAAATGFSWTTIPVTADGNWCVDKSGSLAIERSRTDRELRVTLAESGGTTRAEVIFPAGQAKASWPGSIAVKNGTYLLLAPDSQMRQVTLHVIGSVPTGGDVMKTLHARGCAQQMQQWLRTKPK